MQFFTIYLLSFTISVQEKKSRLRSDQTSREQSQERNAVVFVEFYLSKISFALCMTNLISLWLTQALMAMQILHQRLRQHSCNGKIHTNCKIWKKTSRLRVLFWERYFKALFCTEWCRCQAESLPGRMYQEEIDSIHCKTSFGCLLARLGISPLRKISNCIFTWEKCAFRRKKWQPRKFVRMSSNRELLGYFKRRSIQKQLTSRKPWKITRSHPVLPR